MKIVRTKNRFMATLTALVLTSFMTAEIDVVLFGFAYLIPEGLIQNIAYLLTVAVSVIFFIWFTRHVYQIETEDMALISAEDQIPADNS